MALNEEAGKIIDEVAAVYPFNKSWQKYCQEIKHRLTEAMGEKLPHGKPMEYWKANAEEDYMKVPISVLKYIQILEEIVNPIPELPGGSDEKSGPFYCVSSDALVHGKPCEKWCGIEACKSLVK
jgi:hypothetical protein